MTKTRNCRKCNGSGQEPDPVEIGREMRELREKAKLSLRAVAAAMSVTPAYVSDLELGRRDWNDDRIKVYRAALKGGKS